MKLASTADRSSATYFTVIFGLVHLFRHVVTAANFLPHIFGLGQLPKPYCSLKQQLQNGDL